MGHFQRPTRNCLRCPCPPLKSSRVFPALVNKQLLLHDGGQPRRLALGPFDHLRRRRSKVEAGACAILALFTYSAFLSRGRPRCISPSLVAAASCQAATY